MRAALWPTAMAVLLLDEGFGLVDCNEAARGLLGPAERLPRGMPLAQLLPEEDRPAWDAQCQDLSLRPQAAVMRGRVRDGRGLERWIAATLSPLQRSGDDSACWLVLLHDETGEQAARSQAHRAEDELEQWFELSGTGMLVYDGTGLILRTNAALDALLPGLPEVLDDVLPELQLLLAWEAGAVSPLLQPGGRPIEREATLPAGDGRRRRVWARLVSQQVEGGVRVKAVLQDRSAEHERDIAQLEKGMLMDTASMRVATFDRTQGALTAADGAPLSDADSLGVGIRRELVAPESLTEFARLQAALRQGERADVRYAVMHPKLGRRWLYTRVEPSQLGGARPTMSIVTLDVTEQESARQRSEQMARLTQSILEHSPVGIAYLRGPALVQCNRRFERMLGFDPGQAAGASLQEILSRSIGPMDGVREALDALAEGRPFEAELPLQRRDGGVAWYALSVRRASEEGPHPEAVAVLADISGLKQQQAQLEQLARDRQLMFNLSQVGIVFQRGARIERANEAMAELTGWLGPELGQIDTADLYESPRACVEFEARIQQGLREAGRFVAERPLRRRDGRLVWVQVAVRPVDPDDADAGLICSFVDIDERRRARESLAQQAERTRAVLNSVLVGIVTVSGRGIEWMNRSARRMFGGELADFVGEPVSVVATPEPDHPLRRTDWLLRLKEGQAETFECRLRGRDGREFWVVGNAVLTGPGGTSGAGDDGAEITFALLDIERRRQAEVSIAAAQASLQRVIETAPMAIALFDAATRRVVQANHTAEQFFGRGVADLPGRAVADCAPPALAAALDGWLAEAAGADGTRAHEWRGPESGDGARVWDCRVTPLSAALGEDGDGMAQLLLVATDVSEQRAAEAARLQAAIAQREVLVREVHHRIKNNLQGVAGLLQQNALRHPELSPLLGEAVGQVQAIAQVYGLQVGSQGPLAVLGLMRAIAGSVQRTFGQAIEVQGEVPHELPEPEAIPVALTVNELLTNALKHGEPGQARCRLRMQVLASGEAVRIEVAGQGRLKAGFDLSQVRGGVSGLGLVRALLPRRSASFTLAQQGDEVVATVELRAPSVRLPGAADGPQSAA